jgi:hypothetical protein
VSHNREQAILLDDVPHYCRSTTAFVSWTGKPGGRARQCAQLSHLVDWLICTLHHIPAAGKFLLRKLLLFVSLVSNHHFVSIQSNTKTMTRALEIMPRCLGIIPAVEMDHLAVCSRKSCARTVTCLIGGSSLP